MNAKQFSAYDIFIIIILAILQFSVVLDFMVIAPLGAQLMRVLEINPKQFGAVVSAYGISAGVSAFATAGFTDKFDRKHLLLFFYGGFIIATFMCALAPNYQLLLIARIFTGMFGGVMSSISFAIVADTFKFEVRGKVMGFIQMAFSTSQILGIPIGLYLAHKFNWHFPFYMIVTVSIIVFFVVLFKVRPINEHLKYRLEQNAIKRLLNILSNSNYLKAFLTTFLLAMGFIVMPFLSTFFVNNLGIQEVQLPLIFLASGLVTIISGPITGSLSDKVGKYKIFVIGSLFAMIMLILLTNLNAVNMWLLIIVNTIFVVFATARMISGSAIMSAVPELNDRGAFMSINSAIQQMSTGIATMLGGFLLVESKNGGFANFEVLGYISAVFMIICAVLTFFINRFAMDKIELQNIKQ
ncbi:MFS transporter [Sphingobacterium siyangense]|uniref:MFS transporter n=1 Tax=Sphingobacterium siyangense TaxID=459529 RepID=A0A420FVA2_9SPHI|nr:MFS transporter [Sphingobacterium siyangense]RKF36842.1 MFS transporter [Sphingobacterium siyangense]